MTRDKDRKFKPKNLGISDDTALPDEQDSKNNKRKSLHGLHQSKSFPNDTLIAPLDEKWDAMRVKQDI